VTAPNKHRHWCIGEDGAARGWHASPRLLVHADARTTGQDLKSAEQAAAVRLVQLMVPGDVEPHLALTGGDLDDRAAMLLTVRQSRVLRRFLLRLVEMAETNA
jgi:hypothetical protein